MHGEPLDVVIVGAGISGLALGLSLHRDGRSFVILEARSRVGGRLDSVGGLDLGATWFWPNESRTRSLVDELGVPTHQQYFDGDAMYHGPDGGQQLEGNPLDVPSYRFSSGADSLPLAITRQLPTEAVKLGTIVGEIKGTGPTNPLSVVSNTGSITARHVALALPPVLAISTIAFAPPLPERLAGLAKVTPVWMGGITKVVIRYPDAFWRRQGRSGSAVSHIGPMRELHDMSGPDGVPGAIFGFVSARQVGEPTVSPETILAQMIGIFGDEAASPDEVIVRDWRAEPYTSPPEVERLTDYETFGHEAYQRPAFEGRLHWASTETSQAFPGHIEGALEAAERTARTILRHLPVIGPS
jgi:monoamine oxidase